LTGCLGKRADEVFILLSFNSKGKGEGMLKKSLLYLTIIIGMFILLPGNGFSKHDLGNLATIEYPEHNQKVPFEVVKIIV